MNKTRLTLLLATCLTTATGCADPARTDTGTSPATANTAGNPGGTTGSSTGGSTGASTGSSGSTGTSGSTGASGSGSTGASGSTSNTGDDASVTEPQPGDCQDDDTTVGNDCPGFVTCTADVDACSLDTQNCCVTKYEADAASCNAGKTCEAPGASAACDGPEDCSGDQICCISITPNGLNTANINHRCVTDETKCTGGIFNSILCHTADDCAEGKDCKPIGNLPFWGSCK